MAKRRTILALAPWVMAGLTGAARPKPARAAALAPGRRLRDLLQHPRSARAVAAAWRANPRSATDLDPRATLAPLARIDDPATARAWLGARIRADFVTGAVLDVDGWVLSRTEVAACLLAAECE